MSISTKDCVEKIVLWVKESGKVNPDYAKQSNWKRISKTGNKEKGFVRTFLNGITNDTVEIHSSEILITNIVFKDFVALPMVPKDKYLFSISTNRKEWDPTDIFGKGTVQVLIGTVAEWKKYKALSDHYTEEEWEDLEPIIDALNLEEICESEFITSGITKAELRQKLIAAGFVDDKEFEKQMNDPIE